VVEALGRLGDSECVGYLCYLLGTEDIAIRLAAARALTCIAEIAPTRDLREAIPALRRYSGRWAFPPEEAREIYRLALAWIERATGENNNLPIPAEPLPARTENLPLPADDPMQQPLNHNMTRPPAENGPTGECDGE